MSCTNKCLECNGSGYVIRESVPLYTICPRCGGTKYVDWVQQAMVKKQTIDKQKITEIIQKNVHTLMIKIKNECALINLAAEVEIKMVDMYDHYINIKKGDLYV